MLQVTHKFNAAHVSHACAGMYTCAYACGPIVYVKGLYTHCPFTVVYTYVCALFTNWYIKQMDKPAQNRSSKHKNPKFFHICFIILITILTYQNLFHYCRIKWAVFYNLLKWNNTLRNKNISKSTTQCNFHSDG